MKVSARNQIKGKIIGVQRGQTTGHVRIDIGKRHNHHVIHHQ